MEAGAVRFDLIDEDGDELPGSWSYEWSGRDPLELSTYAVTELSGKPWKWTSRREGSARLSPKKCRAIAIRLGKVLRAEVRARTASVIARIIANETMRPGNTPPDAESIAEILGGERVPDWDAGPQESTPAMMRALRDAVRAAVECEAGLRISWGETD